MLEKLGLYKINCKTCDKKYLGQAKRKIMTKFKEHLVHVKYDRLEKFSIAKCILQTNHNLELSNVEIVKHVISNKLLNSYESIFVKVKPKMTDY